jgi:hypothetical protein
MTHWFAKIFGWGQFALTAGTQIFAQPVHGWAGWLTSVASFAAAIGIHAASSTDGTK